jgi:hypothetical protein
MRLSFLPLGSHIITVDCMDTDIHTVRFFRDEFVDVAQWMTMFPELGVGRVVVARGGILWIYPKSRFDVQHIETIRFTIEAMARYCTAQLAAFNSPKSKG